MSAPLMLQMSKSSAAASVSANPAVGALSSADSPASRPAADKNELIDKAPADELLEGQRAAFRGATFEGK
jgi:hypothetical protein